VILFTRDFAFSVGRSSLHKQPFTRRSIIMYASDQELAQLAQQLQQHPTMSHMMLPGRVSPDIIISTLRDILRSSPLSFKPPSSTKNNNEASGEEELLSGRVNGQDYDLPLSDKMDTTQTDVPEKQQPKISATKPQVLLPEFKHATLQSLANACLSKHDDEIHTDYSTTNHIKNLVPSANSAFSSFDKEGPSLAEDLQNSEEAALLAAKKTEPRKPRRHQQQRRPIPALEIPFCPSSSFQPSNRSLLPSYSIWISPKISPAPAMPRLVPDPYSHTPAVSTSTSSTSSHTSSTLSFGVMHPVGGGIPNIGTSTFPLASLASYSRRGKSRSDDEATLKDEGSNSDGGGSQVGLKRKRANRYWHIPLLC